MKPKAMNDTQLMAAYDIGYKAWKAWLKRIKHKLGEKDGKAWSPAQVKIMFEHWGNPDDEE
jgi:hypothetical protein